MKACSRLASAAPRHQGCGVSLSSTCPACISEMRSQRSASFHEMGRDEDGDAVAARQLHHQAPEVGHARSGPRPRWARPESATRACAPWPRPATGAGGFPAAVVGQVQHHVQAETAHHFAPRSGQHGPAARNRRACSTRFCRTVSSPYSEKRLRHIAHAAARWPCHAGPLSGRTAGPGLAGGQAGRSASSWWWTCRSRSSQKAEDFAAPNSEADVVHGA